MTHDPKQTEVVLSDFVESDKAPAGSWCLRNTVTGETLTIQDGNETVMLLFLTEEDAKLFVAEHAVENATAVLYAPN